MTVCTVNHLPAATHGETARFLFVLELIEEMRARVSRETGRAVEVISCYEAGYDGFWLHRQLEAHGIRNYVIDPASLQVDRRGGRGKSGPGSTPGGACWGAAGCW